MKIKYQFVNESVEIEVDEEWANVVIELDRLEHNSNQTETRRHCSLEALNLDDAYLPSDVDVEKKYWKVSKPLRSMMRLASFFPVSRSSLSVCFSTGKRSQRSQLKRA